MVDRRADWTMSVFDEEYIRLWSFPSVTRSEVVALVNWLPTPPASLLDVACGTGRHSLALAREGFEVTGIDSTRVFLFLDLARRASSTSGLNVRFHEADMRLFDFNGFNAAVMLGNSFGYHTYTENLNTLTRIVNAVVDGGRVVIELLNRHRISSEFRRAGEHVASDGTLVTLTSSFDERTGMMSVAQRWTDLLGQRQERLTRQRLYTEDELRAACQAAGLTDVEIFDGFTDQPFRPASRRMLMVATRG